MRHTRCLTSAIAGVVLCAMLGACAASYEKQLQDVAKNWSLTIRAAGVLPVYPLSDDIRPGDVFLVTQPMDRQTDLYKEKGFLPFEQFVARLDVDGFDEFYSDRYFTDDYAPGPKGKSRLQRTVPAKNKDDELRIGLAPAFANPFSVPRASFPTYTVEFDRSTGFRGALPIQSVPVGVGLLNAESATASVQIADAYTYAAPPSRLRAALQRWLETDEEGIRLSNQAERYYQDDNRDQLQNNTITLGGVRYVNNFGFDYKTDRDMPGRRFLRVVQRVYLAGGLAVTVSKRTTSAGGVDAGAAKAIDLLSADDRATAARRAEAAEKIKKALNTSLQDQALPGASIRVASATSSSVSMIEEFDRPVAIGYLAIDFELLPGGVLGPGFSTLELLSDRADIGPAGPRVLGERSVAQAELTTFQNRIDARARNIVGDRAEPLSGYENEPDDQRVLRESINAERKRVRQAKIDQMDRFRVVFVERLNADLPQLGSPLTLPALDPNAGARPGKFGGVFDELLDDYRTAVPDRQEADARLLDHIRIAWRESLRGGD